MITEVTHQNWHMQGFAPDGNGMLYWSFTDSVVKTTVSGTMIAQVHVSGGHLGDITYHNGKLYSSFLGSPQPGHAWDDWTSYKLYVFDADDLKLLQIIDLPICDKLRADADTGNDPYGFHAIDGVTFGTAPTGEEKLFVACAILTGKQYANQLILQFDTDGSFETLHTVPIGNTVFGIQNLAFDASTGCFWFTTYGPSEPYQARDTLFCVEPDLHTLHASYRFSTPYGFSCTGNGTFLASVQAGVNGNRSGYAYSCTEALFSAGKSAREIDETVLKGLLP